MIRGCVDVPKIQTLAAQPRTAWALADLCAFGPPYSKPTLSLVGNVAAGMHRVARKCGGTGGRCSVLWVFVDICRVCCVSGRQHLHILPSMGCSSWERVVMGDFVHLFMVAEIVELRKEHFERYTERDECQAA